MSNQRLVITILFCISYSVSIEAQMVSFANSNIHYSKEKAPDLSPEHRWQAKAWRGEKINTQILVWCTRADRKAFYKLADLVSAEGGRIDARYIRLNFLRYVWTDGYFENGCGKRNHAELDSSQVADIIDTVSSMPIEARTLQPMWLSIDVPASTPAGLYRGSMVIHAAKPVVLQVELTVSERVLPPASQWQFDLDLWQHPAAIARINNLPLWSDAHFSLMKPYYEMLAAAGQKAITASIIEEPWGHQTFDNYPSLVKWIKRKDGSFHFDYSVFDRYVSFVMSCGITKRINCYSMLPWKLSFRYFDEALSRDTMLVAAPGSDAYNAYWRTMLTDLTRHLKEKGWFEISAIAMDERPLESMQSVIRLLKEVDKDWKLSLAGGYHVELVDEIADYSVFNTYRFSKEELARRGKAGKATTFYTSCDGEKPNMFTFSSPAESVWMGWIAAAKGFTGYLRWAFNSWTPNPLLDSRYITWPAGDAYQIYPGPRSSVRFEKLVEGIRDFEKIRVLRDEWLKKGHPEELMALDKMLALFELGTLDDKAANELVQRAEELLNGY